MFRRHNAWRSSGPQNITASVLKTYSKELAPLCQPIFQHRLTIHTLSTQSEKTSRFIPLPNKPCPKGYKDFGLAALTSILVKSFKGIISNMRINQGYA